MFKFTYYDVVNGVTVAEISCRVEVNGRTGEHTVYMRDILSDAETEPNEYYRPKLEYHVANDLRIELQEAVAGAVCGTRQYDREMARGTE